MIVSQTNINLGGGNVLAPNTVIPEGTLSDSDLAAFLKKGAVAEISDAEVTEPVAATVADAEVTEPAAPPKGPKKKKKKPAKPYEWAFNAKDLQGRTLDQLNMDAADHCLRHGRDPIKPFTDLEEAFLYMTQDAV